MKEKEELVLKELTDDDIFRGYKEILEVNCEYYATYIIEILSLAITKSKTILLKDRLRIILNYLIYKYNSFWEPERKELNFELMFKEIYLFLTSFKNIQKVFKELLNKDLYTPEEAADLYLYYFTLLSIHNNIFDLFDGELKRESLSTMNITIQLPFKKTISDNITDFNTVTQMIRQLKKEDNA